MEKLLIFKRAHYFFGVSMNNVKEILFLPELVVPPEIPEWLKGFLNYGGTLIPVILLDTLLKIEKQKDHLYSSVIILKNCELPVSFLTDSVVDIVEINEKQPLPIDPNILFNDFLDSVTNLLGKNIYILSLKKIFLEKERQTLLFFQHEAERRLNLIEQSEKGVV